MIKLKTVPFFKESYVFQTTMRELSDPFVFEKNVIELFSENEINLEKAVVNKLLCTNLHKNEILEIGPKQLFKSSIFMPIDELVADELVIDEDNYYKKIDDVLDEDVQLIVVQIGNELSENEMSILSEIAHSSNKLRIILFLTIGNQPKILPILNFSQIQGQPIINIVEYREYYKKNNNIIQRIYNSLLYNIMV